VHISESFFAQLLSVHRHALGLMKRARPLILAVIGALCLCFVVYNVEIGLYYFQYPDQLVHYKMELTKMFGGGCDKATINADLTAHRSSECLSPLGTYHATDIIVAGFGLLCSIFAPLLALKQAGKLKVSRSTSKNIARLRLMFGISLISVGVGDAIGLFTADGSNLDWSQVFGIELPAFVVDIIFVIGGILVVKKAIRRLRSKSEIVFAEPWQSAAVGNFRGSLEKSKSAAKKGGVMTVGDLRSALSLDQYEDIFQLGTSTEDDMSVGRQCHYCNGQGCEQCNFKGEFF